jgi:hypothetical protein
MAEREPLALPEDNWRSRWLVTPKWTVLHRISEIEWEEVEKYGGSLVHGRGVAVCGVNAHFRMPGIFSRMGLPRCALCCRRLGIPRGDGAPFNALEGDLANA